MKLTIDASVWVSAFIAGDVHHAQSDQLLESCLALRAKVIVPEIVLLETEAVSFFCRCSSVRPAYHPR